MLTTVLSVIKNRPLKETSFLRKQMIAIYGFDNAAMRVITGAVIDRVTYEMKEFYLHFNYGHDISGG